MRRMFKKFDTGGDATAAGNGSIDKTELGELMKTIGFASMTDDKVRAIANALDKDGDEEISENEFVAWYARTVCHHAPASAGGRARKAPTVTILQILSSTARPTDRYCAAVQQRGELLMWRTLSSLSR